MTVALRAASPTIPLADGPAETLSLSQRATPRILPEPITLDNPTTSTAAYTRMPLDKSSESGSSAGGGITFAAQDKLPKLPIPHLASTCDKYLEALKPLQSPRERAETEHAVKDFLSTDGPDLQEKLKKYARGKTSYIEQFCQ